MDLDYIARIVDSGAYFSIQKPGSSYSGTLRIKRKDLATLQNINSGFGGYIAKGKDGYWINFHGDTLIRFLEAIYPKLILKREHCQILMEFLQEVKKNKNGKSSGRQLTDQQRVYRESLMEKLKRLNAR